MRAREGDRIKSILTGKVYEVTAIKDGAVVLHSLEGSSQVWTEGDNLDLFYEKVESEEFPGDLARSPAKPKLCRAPLV
jgi:hypothetical protein